ncbi:uncharacterized protein K452DRAFT_359265 [Aplosporella prunicola CBS 121167]|uniref:Heterokaryon incompatibility domain-containing protein n=1 Tax=Aplosporella prunicola CBS 121167 TaxID=1176127 RepID=A0A6A6B9R8_9PEZI|nr:uncharacterized protein K452DRAFT_359265 [Aplosporella prunicola CBS 121167]KAF2140810.1 hypothetical protein K452DRAFT_359265 [Aplosporella prunicola CBS 121167]
MELSPRPKKRQRRKVDEPIKLCTNCLNLFTVFRQQEMGALGGYNFCNLCPIFSTVHDLKRSMRRCPMCSMMWTLLRKKYDTAFLNEKIDSGSKRTGIYAVYNEEGCTDVESIVPSKKYLRSEMFLRRSVVDSLLQLSLSLRIGAQSSYRYSAQQYTLDEELLVSCQTENEWTRQLGIPIDQRLQDEAKFTLMKKWVFENPGAVALPVATFFPTRLLHVGEDKNIRLVDITEEKSFHITAGKEEPLRYVALSHRWGASRHLTSTRETVNKLYSGIRVEDLPMTFRDAFSVISRLGLSYLWIDALKMGDVYGQALFTIAAHCAIDDSEGFLANSLSKRRAVEYNLDSATTIQIYRPPDMDMDVTGSQLCKRGWVLQERFLSPRTIHFTEGQIYYETAEGISSESGPLESGSSSADTLAELLESQFFGPSAAPNLRACFEFSTGHMEPSNDNLAKENTGTPLEWLNLVEMYSNCYLTNEGDKLMAIAGMAQKVHHYTKVPYCAGIWGDRICESLLWLPKEPLSSPVVQRAPSWSWASKVGPVQFLRWHRFISSCKLIGVNTELVGSTNGRNYWLNGPGSLQLEIEIIRMPKATISNSKKVPFSADSKMNYGNTVDMSMVINKEDRYWTGWLAFDTQGHNAFEYMTFERMVKIPGFCFGVVGYSQDSINKYGDTVLYGLFLTRTGPESNEYRRVGFGILSAEHLRDMACPLHNSTIQTISIV